MGTNWFVRHINWTWVIMAFIGMAIFSIFWALTVGYSVNIGSAALWTLLPAHATALRLKNRSGLWIFLCFFIWITPLFLTNKTVKENENGNTKQED